MLGVDIRNEDFSAIDDGYYVLVNIVQQDIDLTGADNRQIILPVDLKGILQEVLTRPHDNRIPVLRAVKRRDEVFRAAGLDRDLLTP